MQRGLDEITARDKPVPHLLAKVKTREGRARLRKGLTPYLLLLPAVGVVTALLLSPMVETVYLSLFKWPFGDTGSREFVGLANYREALFDSQEFRSSLKFTAFFTAVTIVLELVLAFAFALLLDSMVRGRAILATIAIMPFMVASIAVGLIWRLLYSYDVGLINYGLESIGLDRLNWLADPTLASWAAIAAEVWASMPFVMLIILAGLTAIPEHLLEAAEIDGATKVQIFTRIKFPLLLPSFTVALVFQTVFKIRVFDLVFILTEGGPGGQTTPLGLLIYKQFFRYSQGGSAAAASVLLLVLGGVICALYVKFLYREVEM